MRRLLTVLLVSLIATPALAEMPPSDYRFPFPGKLVVHKVKLGEAAKTCRKLGMNTPDRINGRPAYGCAIYRDLPGK